MSAVRRRRAELLASLRARKRQRRQRVSLVLAAMAALMAVFVLQDCTPHDTGLALKSTVSPKVAQPDTRGRHSAPVASQDPPEAEPSARQATQGRPDLSAVQTSAPLWLSDFQRQVAQRSPVLAACFEGADGPGRLEWTTTVNSQVGRVSEHALHTMSSATSLSQLERTCVLQALSLPRYDLRGSGDIGAPARIRMAIVY